MAGLPSSPGVGRPAQGFNTGRAQKWILTAAVLSAVIYGFRRIVEGSNANTVSRGTAAQKLAGTGTPPTLAHWAVAYGAGFLMLSIISLGAPEVAASFAMLVLVGEALTNGKTIAADIAQLEGTSPNVPVTTGAGSVAQATTGAVQAAGTVAGDAADAAGTTATAGTVQAGKTTLNTVQGLTGSF